MLKNKPRIGFVCHEYPPCNHGGIGSFTKDLAEGLTDRGWHVTVVGVYQKNVLPLNRYLREEINGVEIHRFPEYRKFRNKRLNLLFSRLWLRNEIHRMHRQHAFDLIETPDSEGWLPFGAPGNIPLVSRLHGGVGYFGRELGRPYSRLAAFFEKLQLRFSQNIISVSRYTAEKTLDLYSLDKPYEVIYNSVAVPPKGCTEFRETEHAENPRILFFGSILRKKGVEELILAMNRVWETHPDVELLMAGKINSEVDGKPYDTYLLERIDSTVNRKKVNFLGPLRREDELYPLLCHSTLCCLPSHAEAFSLAPLEAMALGRPVIYSILHSGPEAIENGKTGLLCNPKDPEDIADKIVALLDDPALRSQIGKNAKQAIKNRFDYDGWIERNIDFYLRAIDR